LVEQNWAGADLKSVISNVTRAYAGSGPRVEADGPAVRLSPQQAISCSLVLHELTTNAAKYGALTRQAGRVRVSWNESLDMSGGRHLTLLWEEIGGPVVRPPERTGFGTKLIKRALKQDGHGEAKLEFLPEGVRCLMHVPLADQGGGVDTVTEALEQLTAEADSRPPR
jgi:two-component sensor histidine kinase